MVVAPRADYLGISVIRQRFEQRFPGDKAAHGSPHISGLRSGPECHLGANALEMKVASPVPIRMDPLANSSATST